MSNHIHLIAVPSRQDSLARALDRAQQRHTRRIHRRRGAPGILWGGRFYSTPLDECHLWTAIKYVELNPLRAGLVARAEAWRWSSAAAHVARRDWHGARGDWLGPALNPLPIQQPNPGRACPPALPSVLNPAQHASSLNTAPNVSSIQRPEDSDRAGPSGLLAPDRPFGGSRPHPLTGRPIGWLEWLALGLELATLERLRAATSTGRPCGSDDFVQSIERKLERLLQKQKPGPKPRSEEDRQLALF